MFDIGAGEMLLVVVVALLVIGPKDLPRAMRTAGQWAGKLRAMTKHFRSGIDAMIREAEIEDQEKMWAERNAEIMREHPSADKTDTDAVAAEGTRVSEPKPADPKPNPERSETPNETDSER